MLYAKRDENGDVSALSREKISDEYGVIGEMSAEVLAFVSKGAENASELQYLTTSDFELVRVIEDITHLLIQKGLIRFTDLPASAQDKLLNRHSAREKLGGESSSVLIDDGGIL